MARGDGCDGTQSESPSPATYDASERVARTGPGLRVLEEQSPVNTPVRKRLVALGTFAVVVLTACSSGATPSPTSGSSPAASTPGASDAASAPASASNLSGSVNIDGSSTVYPITEAVAEEFQKANSGVKVTVAFAGTGGGFKKFCNGETDMNDASRPIKPEEDTACKAKSIDYVELGVATDALSVVVNKDNTWATCLTTAQLKKMWDQGSTAKTWADIDPKFPADPLKLFGPGPDSGTFDYFTEVINGKAKQSRSDYTPSEDDNALVTGVAGDKDALGYFGFAYLEANLDKIKPVAIDSGAGCIEPSKDNVNAGKYKPLARPLFIYPSKAALKRPELAGFVQYYLDNVNKYVDETGYIEALPDVLAKSKTDLAAALK
jgi:phosphate transport system substrate-binding protein